MKNSLSLMALVLALGLGIGIGDAEAAKRLGGGKSTGMQRQSTAVNQAPTTPGQSPASPTTANAAAKAPAAAPAAAAAAQPKRSWMGPLAGLAAGLGLAALASHLGFGEELASMLMIGLLVMAALAVVGFILRKRAMSQRPAMAGAAGGMQYAGAGQDVSTQRAYDVAMPAGGTAAGSVIGSQIGANLNPSTDIPADFDVAGFERNAKVQFIRLQAANDTGNLNDIREFTTPEMFAEIKMDMADRGATQQQTEVVSVNAQVLEVAEEAERYVVSVRFTGSIREAHSAELETFDEVWHLLKARQGNSGWMLSGIQQVSPQH